MTRRWRRFTILLILLGLAGLSAGAWSWIRARLDPERLNAEVLAAVNRILPGGSALVSIGSTSFSLGGGLLIQDASIQLPPGDPSKAAADFFHAPRIILDARLGSLALGRPRFRSVEIHDLELSLRQNADGSWLIPDALRRLADSSERPVAAPAPPVLRVHNATVRLHLEKPPAGPLDLTLAKVDAILTSAAAAPNGPANWQFSGRGQGAGCESFSLFGQASGSQIEIDRLAAFLDLGKLGELALPEKIKRFIADWQLRGKVSLIGSLVLGKIGQGGPPERLHVTATWSQGELAPPQQAFPIRAIGGTVVVLQDAVKIERLKGFTRTGTCELTGTFQWRSDGGGGIQPCNLDLACRLDQLELDPELLGLLPPSYAEIIVKNRIRGSLALQAVLKSPRWPPGPDHVALRLEPMGMSAAHAQFPYPVDSISGGLALSNGKIVFDPPLKGLAGSARLELDGEVALLGEKKSAGRLRLAVKGASLDAGLRNCLPEPARQVWDDFTLSGKADAQVHIEWAADGARPKLVVAATPRLAKFRYRPFPVSIDQLEGELVFDIFERQVKIPRLRGRHIHQLIEGEGGIGLAEPHPRIDLRIAGESLALDQELLAALPEEVRGPLRSNRVSGKAGIEVRIASAGQGKAVPSAELTLKELVIHPPSFPSPLLVSAGKISFDGKDLHFQELQGAGSPGFQVGGDLLNAGGEKKLRLQGEVRDFEFTDRNLFFFPEAARQNIRAMEVGGLHDFSFEAEIVLAAPAAAPRRFSYRIPRLRSRQAGLYAGVRLSKIAAAAEISGGGVLGGSHFFSGKVRLESAYFNRLKLEEATLYVSYGAEHPAIAAARSGQKFAEIDFMPGSDFTERLKPETLRGTLQVSLGPASLFGGKVRGYFYTDLGDLHDMRGHFLADGIDLAKAAVEVFELEPNRAAGSGSGEVQFRGLTGSPSSILGVGKIQVTGGNFAGIPLFSSLFDLAFPGWSGSLNFNALEAQFAIKDEQFQTTGDRIVLRGPGLNLRGDGNMNFYETIDLNFVPEIIDLDIPIADALKKSLARIHLAGTLQRPQAEIVVGSLVPLPLGNTKK